MTLLIFLLSFIPLCMTWGMFAFISSIKGKELFMFLPVVFVGAIGLVLFVTPILVWTGVLK